MSRMLRRYLEAQADAVEAVLQARRLPGRITGGTVGPRLIRFFLDPGPQTSFAAVRHLAEDLALALKVSSLRIDRSHEGIVLEFPNPEPRPVTLLGLWPEVQPLPATTALLGLTDDGAPLLTMLPSPEIAHVLITGMPNAGKTALLRTMAVSLALGNAPETLRLLCLDPQGRAFRALLGAPHLTRPPVVDVGEAGEALQSVERLMTARLRQREHWPRIVVCVDNMVDLLVQSDAQRHSQATIATLLIRLVQQGHLAGIHLIVATARPNAAVLSEVLRANFPLRLVGKAASAEEARAAAGRAGIDAHLLNERGDFLAVGGSAQALRFQAAYIGAREAQAELAARYGPANVHIPSVPSPVPASAGALAPQLAWEVG